MIEEISGSIDFLISVEKLDSLMQSNTPIVIVDVRSKEEYDKGHIPNSVNVPEVFTYLPVGMTSEDEKKEFAQFFEEIFSNAGIEKDEIVVFYEDKYTLKSPRGLTILKYLGYDEEKIKILEGGFHLWSKNSFTVSTIKPVVKRKKFRSNVLSGFFVDYDEMLKLIYDESVVKLDVRDEDEWIGISSSPYGLDFAPKKGRLPNAIWIEWYEFITSDMLSVDNLERIQHQLEIKSLSKDDDIILYCFKGARVSNTYIALRKLGYNNIRIYFAGWNEWCRKEGAPIINEVQDKDNALLKENIALKRKLDKLNIEKSQLIDFPKYNQGPVFSFDRDGKISFENQAKKILLPDIKTCKDIVPDVSQSDLYNLIDNQLEKSVDFQNGEKFYLLNIKGSRATNSVLVYGLDTTELNTINERLKKEVVKQSETFETIFEKSSDAIFIISEKQYSQCNEAALKMFGFGSKDEFLKYDIAKLSPKYQDDGMLSFEKAGKMLQLAKEKGVHSYEWKNIRTNGEEFYSDVTITPIILDTKDVFHVVRRDITEKKKLEEELNNYTHNLEKQILIEVQKNKIQQQKMFDQSRLAQMGEMISMIAHQWRQPLGAVAAIAIDIDMKIELEHFDLEKKDDRSKFLVYLQEKLKNIDSLIRNLTNTIDDFRNFYKPNKELDIITINCVVKKALGIIGATIQSSNIEIYKELNSSNKLSLLENEMMQVVLNILKNSQDNFQDQYFTDKSITIKTYDEDNKTVLEIVDNGGGIDEKALDKIFDPYFSTKDAKNGTGLGMYMSKTIVENHHNGKIHAHNTDEGACFIIELFK